MGNMSYCRFQNTTGDVADCIEAFEERVSGDEASARARLVIQAIDIVCKARDLLGLDDMDELHDLGRRGIEVALAEVCVDEGDS